MDLWAVKLISLFILFFVCFLFSFLPFFLHRSRNPRIHLFTHRLISVVNCCGGGVFLATVFIHLLPESRDSVANAIPGVKFPLSELLVCSGFLLIMFFEHALMSCRAPRQSEVEIQTEVPSSSGEVNVIVERHLLIQKNARRCQNYGATNSANEADWMTTSCVHARECVASGGNREMDMANLLQNMFHRDASLGPTDKVSAVREVVLVAALGFHTLLEGLALGLQPTSTDTWLLTWALLVHKSVIALALGGRLFAGENILFVRVVALLIFSLMCPLGVAIGILLGAAPDAQFHLQLVEAICQSIASGSFLYVTFFEVLLHEVGVVHSIGKVLLVIFGFAGFSTILIFLEA